MSDESQQPHRVLWIAPNMNHYKAQFLDQLAMFSELQIVVLAGAPQNTIGHQYIEGDFGFELRHASASKSTFAFDPRTYLSLFRLLREGFDSVLMPIEKKHLPLVMFLSLVRWIFRFNLVSYNHRSVRSGAKTTRLDLFLSRIAFRQYDKVIFYTRKSMDWALEKGLVDHRRADFGNNTLNTTNIWKHYRFEIRDLSPPAILFIGRLVPAKRLDLLSMYFTKLIKKIPDLQLHVVGDGPERRTIERLAEAHASSVFYHGAESDEARLAEIFRQTNIVFVPGHSGLSVVHAFAYGKPYVTTVANDVNHAPEIDYVDHDRNGLLLNDVNSGVVAIHNLLTDVSRYREMCRQAFQTAQELKIEKWCSRIRDALLTDCKHS